MKWVVVLGAAVPCLAAEYSGNVAGRVSDAATGRPIEGAAVVAVGDAAADSRRSRSDATGRFLVNALPVEYPSSTYSVLATAPGYEAQLLKDVRVLPGAVMALECAFALSRPRTFDTLTKMGRPGVTFLYSHERSVRLSRAVRGGQIFATREGLVGRTTANGHVIRNGDRFVALPSRRALNANGDRLYRVRIRYRDRLAVAPVWDIGPWNIRDDYWNPPKQRESWRSLPRGMPEAQAAFRDGFNGGRDGFGRKVLNPAGIDLSDAVFQDDLQMRDNDWVSLEYLWDTRLISTREPARPRQRVPGSRRRTVEEIIALAEAILIGRR
ncbi:MAG TPA: carboxypeptidase-like regulatory domain-containing protein [Bryobacteraceae bacterium]|nr:carboxypeptidase-like regulatory domain-containing protein [Bryobacteraceae bacterium]